MTDRDQAAREALQTALQRQGRLSGAAIIVTVNDPETIDAVLADLADAGFRIVPVGEVCLTLEHATNMLLVLSAVREARVHAEFWDTTVGPFKDALNASYRATLTTVQGSTE